MRSKLFQCLFIYAVGLLLGSFVFLYFFPPKDIIYNEVGKLDFSILNKKFDENKKIWNIELVSKDKSVVSLVSLECKEEPKNENPILLYQKKEDWSFFGIFQPKYEFSYKALAYNCLSIANIPEIKSTKLIPL